MKPNMKTLKLYKYQGAGNDFLIADNRDGAIREDDGTLYVAAEGHEVAYKIENLCDRRYGVGADGLMLLDAAPDGFDFKMTYFNSDGSGGMMCGNGGRCIVAFAADCGIRNFQFVAADGPHSAQILSSDKNVKIVRLKMKDVAGYSAYDALTGPDAPTKGYFLDTGTRHYVRFVKDLEEYDVVGEGRDIRLNAEELKPVGANVNFVEPVSAVVNVRTYEKGVEDETFACGTGIVASCIASYVAGIEPSEVCADGRVRYAVNARRDALAVDFMPGMDGLLAEDVWLTGPATYVADVLI
jgi:diaminopimelate epimerase